MSRSHAAEQEVQDQSPVAEEQSFDITFGLPPPVFGRLRQLSVDDTAALADLLKTHPKLHDQILNAASFQLGLSVVKRAQAIEAGRPEAEAPRNPQLNAVAKARPDWHNLQATVEDGDQDVEARKYNDAHAALVDEFNRATDHACMSLTTLSVTMVARWQEQHGLKGDGKVGPLTIAAARKPAGGLLDHGLTKERLDAAQRYNDAHPDRVAQVKAVGVVDSSGHVSAEAVARFQKTRGLDVDGRIGPATVASAQAYADANPTSQGLE